MALTENEKRSDKKEKPLTKVVIRRLPPTMTQEQFLNQVSPVPDYNYLYHVKGDMSLGENAFSRAYINFSFPDDVYSFKERFDNYVFVDGKGHEYQAVVEFAPFQKIPKKRGKNRMDPKCNSIESDSYFLEFVANLNKPVEQDAKPEYTLQLNERSDEKKDTTTPLLEYIKNKRAQRLKIREVRREERERRKKEFEKRKEYGKYYEGKYQDERKYEEKSPTKSYNTKSHAPKSPKNETAIEKSKTEISDEKTEKLPKEKTWSEGKIKEKKYEEKKERKEIKPRFPKKEYPENRDFKRDDYSHREFRSKHYEDYKSEDRKTYPKKVKKYSEKREERKIEAQKAEQRKLEQQALTKEAPISNSEDNSTKVLKEKAETLPFEKGQSDKDLLNEEKDSFTTKSKESSEDLETVQKHIPLEKETDKEEKRRENDDKSESSSSRRIRNKDRPTIPLYRPGMLSKKKQNETDDKIETKTEPIKE